MTILSVFKFLEEFFRVTWLSVSSTKFYPDLYKKYRGYGFKYIIIAISMTSIVYATFIFSSINSFKYYLNNDDGENNPVEFILKQWPEVKYDGQSILLADSAPVLLRNIAGKVVLAIDSEGNLSEDQKQKIPVILAKTKIIVSLEQSGNAGKKRSNVTTSYNDLLGKDIRELNHDTVKALLIDLLQPVGLVMFAILIPVLIILRFAIHILRNLFSMVLLFVVFWWMGLEPTVKSTSRVVLFSSGAPELLSIFSLIFLAFSPAIAIFSVLLEYWTVILAVYSISKMRR